MSRFPILLLAALASALAGCATAGDGDRTVLDHPPPGLDRSNGQPRLWPCMIGDVLCQPKP